MKNLTPPVVGVDEAGRGCLAGPVCAGAVILSSGFSEAYRDSKVLSPDERRRYAFEISKKHRSALGWADSLEIDRMNILQASLLAMRRAVLALKIDCGSLLVDGQHIIPNFKQFTQIPVIKGDSFVNSIAAASITAKHFRDEAMMIWAEKYPLYGFEKHKGYPTAEHKKALLEFGPCPIHRKTFSGAAECLRP